MQWTRVASGHYRHDGTGVEIKRADRYREHGVAVGVRWHLTVPMADGTRDFGTTRSLASAKEWAEGPAGIIEVRSRAIADLYDEALIEDAERDAFTQGYEWAERHDLPSGRREHVLAAIDADHAEAVTMNDTITAVRKLKALNAAEPIKAGDLVEISDGCQTGRSGVWRVVEVHGDIRPWATVTSGGVESGAPVALMTKVAETPVPAEDAATDPDDLPDPDGTNTLPIPDGPWFHQEEDQPTPMPRCTRPSDWSEPHLFEDDEIELNPEGYDEYERCERPADDPLHIEGARAAIPMTDAKVHEAYAALPAVPADLNDDAAWAAYCAALPDPTEAEIAAVLAEHTGPYAEQIAHADEGFRAAARMIRQWRSAGGVSQQAYHDLRTAMSNYASNGRIYRTLTEVYALGLISDAHVAASYGTEGR
jgi:hypothetical protein